MPDLIIAKDHVVSLSPNCSSISTTCR